MSPHSRAFTASMRRSPSKDRWPPKLTMWYVVMSTPHSGCRSSLTSAVNSEIRAGSSDVQSANWAFHWATAVAFVHSTSVDRFTVAAATIAVSVLPAPHGRTMMPLRARPLPNIFDSDFSW